MLLTCTKHCFADYWTGDIPENYQSTNTGTYPVVHNDWPTTKLGIHPELTVHQK
jgi:hypothetical protein